VSDVRIDQAFISDYEAQGFGIPTTHENHPGESDPDGSYATTKVTYNQALPADMNDTNDVTGVFRVEINAPLFSGSITPKQQVANILAAYPVGRRFSYNGMNVTVTATEMSSAPDKSAYKVTGFVYYTAEYAR
tara:strand:- start:14073 stop:14471 length:399 start_codon:yes stop_codon:yes gene_type:complete